MQEKIARRTRLRPGSQLHQTAVHEAGHAVAHVRLGILAGNVTIIPNANEHSLGAAMAEQWWTDDDGAAEHHIVAAMAGYAAQVRFAPSARRLAWIGSRRDLEEADEIVGARLPRGRFLRRAHRFVRRAANWRAILLVARELLVHRWLRDDEVELLIMIADGEEVRRSHEILGLLRDEIDRGGNPRESLSPTYQLRRARKMVNEFRAAGNAEGAATWERFIHQLEVAS